MCLCVLCMIDCVMLNGSFLGGVFVVLVCASVCCFNVFVDCVSDLMCDGVRFMFLRAVLYSCV